jgi:hypothetical protein
MLYSHLILMEYGVVSEQIQKMPLYPSCMLARCVQSLHSFHSAVELVGLFLNHHHHKPSSTAQRPTARLEKVINQVNLDFVSPT